jgi:hypothetical protein
LHGVHANGKAARVGFGFRHGLGNFSRQDGVTRDDYSIYQGGDHEIGLDLGSDGVLTGSDVLPHDHRELKPYRGTGRGGLLAEQGGRAENDGEYHMTDCGLFAEHIVPLAG